MLDASSPPSWLRPAALRWVDASDQFYGLGALRMAIGPGRDARTPEWSRAWSDVVHSHRTLEALRDAGVTAITIHFDHGFGPSAQAEEFRRAARFAQSCRDFDLRVFAYVEAGALYYETLLPDRPGIAAWAQRDGRGDIIRAEGKPAWMPCYRSRGYLEMLKDSISMAGEQVGVDGIYLANLGPHACRCERCQATFRTLLASRHPEPAASFGLHSLDHVRLPSPAAVNDPLRHEAAYFEVYALRSALAELRIHLRSISAQVALWADPRLTSGPSVDSCTALWELSAPADVITCNVPLGNHDALRARAHAYLAGHGTRTTACVAPMGDPTPEALYQELGVALAFGGHVLAGHGALRPADPAMTPRFSADGPTRDVWRSCLEFAARHEHYQHRATSIADVALAFSTTDVASEPIELATFQSAEQSLIDAGIPFDLVPIESADPGRHAVLAIAGQPRMLEAEGDVLRGIAEGGGALVLVGDVGTRDGFGRRRRVDVFAAIDELDNVKRVVSPDDIPGAIAKLMSDPPVVEIEDAPAWNGQIAVRPYRLPTGQATLQIANVGDQPAEGIRLRVRRDLVPSGHVAWHDPGSADRMLDCATDADTVITALPPLHAYALIVTS